MQSSATELSRVAPLASQRSDQRFSKQAEEHIFLNRRQAGGGAGARGPLFRSRYPGSAF